MKLKNKFFNLIFLFIACFHFNVGQSFAEDSYKFNSNQIARFATTVLVSQLISQTLLDINVDQKTRIMIGNIFVIGTATTSELLSQNFSKNNLLTVGMGVLTSNLLTISFDW